MTLTICQAVWQMWFGWLNSKQNGQDSCIDNLPLWTPLMRIFWFAWLPQNWKSTLRLEYESPRRIAQELLFRKVLLFYTFLSMFTK
jgi:hypothetical protein